MKYTELLQDKIDKAILDMREDAKVEGFRGSESESFHHGYIQGLMVAQYWFRVMQEDKLK